MSSIELVPMVRVDQQKIALIFTDHLNHLGITAKTLEDNGSFVICCDSTKTEQARAIFEEFARQPYHPKYQQSSWQSGQVQGDNLAHSSDFQHFKNRFLMHAGPVTLTVFAACWLVFLISVFGGANTLFGQLHFFGDFEFDAILTEPWRLLTPAIFHFSWLHIIFNTLWWWQLGGDIETRLGKVELFSIFLQAAVISNIAQYLMSGPNFGGLSGVVYALVGYCWWTGWLAPERGVTLARPIVGFMLVWLLLGFTSFMPINVANTAHLVGLLCGCSMAYIKHKKKAN